jgi:hypothetical protein
VSLFRHARVRRTRRGTYRLDLPPAERALLRRLLPELRGLLTEPDPDGRTRRLYPTAYADDEAAEEEFHRLTRDELVTSRLAALDAVEATLDATELDEAQLSAWMGSVNSVRLVLGTLLDVSEHVDIRGGPEEEPDVETYALYSYLSGLLEEIVGAVDPP